MIWVIFWNISRIYFFFFRIQIIKSNCYIIFLKFSQSSFLGVKCIPSQLYLFIKDLIFVFLCGSFIISSQFYATFTAYWKHLLSFLLIGFIVAFLFLSSQENLDMIHLDKDLFYDIYNTITEHNQK